MKPEKPEFRAGANEVRRDAQGREVCPECGGFDRTGNCRNCFHSRSGMGVEELDFYSPEVAAEIERRKRAQQPGA